jgi:hypothetical protein
MSEPWLGHENGCCSQWSDFCDCIDPNNPIDLSVPDEMEDS